MIKEADIGRRHPLRALFRTALDFGFKLYPSDKAGIADYIEEQILCEFIRTENLYKIMNAAGQGLEDIADMLAEGDVFLNAQSFEREFYVHKHIGDFTLFMLGMFPMLLSRRRGKEFIMSRIIVPSSKLSDHYVLQGQRSYRIASEFAESRLFLDLSANFMVYKNVLELASIYLESVRSKEILDANEIIAGTSD